jgi:hypothetical protein
MFTLLNPVKIYHSADAYYKGNPDLLPSQTFSQDIGYYFNSKYMLLVGHNITLKSMTLITFTKNGSVTENTPINYGQRNNIYIVFNVNQSLFNNQLYINANFNGNYTNYKSEIPEINEDKSVFDGSINVSATFIPSNHNTWQMKTDLQYYTPSKTVVSYNEYSSYRGSLEISKKINELTLTVSGFYSLRYFDGSFSTKSRSRYIVDSYKSYSVTVGEYRGLMLKASYNFGNKKVRSEARRETSVSNYDHRFRDNK